MRAPLVAQVLYESDALLAQVLATHYGPPDAVFAALAGESGILHSALHFHRRVAEDAAAWAQRCGRPLARALDLGCSVGRGSFELARHFGEVVGVDLSNRVVEVATKLRENRRFEYDCKVEGDVTARLAAVVDDSVDTSRCTFVTVSRRNGGASAAMADERVLRGTRALSRWCCGGGGGWCAQGDACALPDEYAGAFDVVLAANLMDRVPDPQRVLQQARAALAPGGVLVLTSPFSWSEEYTDRGNWLGGAYKDGVPVRCARAGRWWAPPGYGTRWVSKLG